MNQLYPIIRRVRRPLVGEDGRAREDSGGLPAVTVPREAVPALVPAAAEVDDRQGELGGAAESIWEPRRKGAKHGTGR